MRQRRRAAVALGEPLETTDEELGILALITPGDIEEAKADGRARMGKRGAALLEAERAEGATADDAMLGVTSG